MRIRTQRDMNDFCSEYKKVKSFIINKDNLKVNEIKDIEMIQDSLISEGVIPEKPISHLQQGIISMDFFNNSIYLEEAPFLFPNPNILDRPELQKYFGALTGVLVNCYDPETRNFLFQMRGKSVDEPFKFQAASAGMGRFRENPFITAKKELEEEAGILYAKPLSQGKLTDILPFMKGEFPQPLFSFSFLNSLSNFPVCNNLDDIVQFENKTKQKIRQQNSKVESYLFTIPYHNLEKTIGDLNDNGKFFGPIYESTINFVKALKDEKYL